MKHGSQSDRRFTLRQTAFSASATLDLLASPFPLTHIAPITMNVGDTLSLDLTFSGSEALEVDNSPSEGVTLVLGADSVPLNAHFVADYSLRLTGLSGEFLTSLPYMTAGGGGFLAAPVSSVLGNLTNSAFTFTGLHADFTLTEANVPFVAERIDLITSLGLVPAGATALRRKGVRS